MSTVDDARAAARAKVGTGSLTEDQIKEAQQLLDQRAKAESQYYSDEYTRKQREAEDRFWAGMLAQHPGISRDTMYEIYSDVRSFYE